jgi:hypothetical protein
MNSENLRIWTKSEIDYKNGDECDCNEEHLCDAGECDCEPECSCSCDCNVEDNIEELCKSVYMTTNSSDKFIFEYHPFMQEKERDIEYYGFTKENKQSHYIEEMNFVITNKIRQKY